jgi:hypothetical protein
MKWFLSLTFVISSVVLGVLSVSPFQAEAAVLQSYSSEALCSIRLSLRYPDRCPPIGPGGKAIELARLGLYPEQALPTVPIDAHLSYLPFGYLRANDGSLLIYSTANAARRELNASAKISPGFVFLSYIQSEYSKESVNAYQSQQGFVSGNSVSRIKPSSFKGLAFSRTPDRPIGWITSGGSCPQRTPGGEVDYRDHCFMRYEVVQIYLEQEVDGETWYMIGVDEWLQAKFVAKVDPDTRRPEGVESNRWISVNLDEQTITAYEDGQLVYATLVSTGRYGTWTQPGTFQVWAKLERDNMTGGVDDGFYYLEDVPWVLYFDQARALHGTYWHTDAHWFFEFAQEGTWVHVWDPSGETPTDPELYGVGGA